MLRSFFIFFILLSFICISAQSYADKPDGFYEVYNPKPVLDTDELLLSDKPSVDFQDVISASRTFDDIGQVVIDLQFGEAGKLKLEELTTRNVGKIIAVLVGGEIVYKPVITEAITEGFLRFSGNFTWTEAGDMVESFKKN